MIRLLAVLVRSGARQASNPEPVQAAARTVTALSASPGNPR